ncbi:G-type lectin S-receptor-like serine threonine-kinase LECRK3 [Olea europaea subsp. europaea]|uniref:non-specific serine/threonine protein kinase n=1 Tax=Olea europaea subsp. europaea TaxID=158383 RepID=A0A8S0S404_OLEEU|nr:G-type lectin S-receptor-like serine threonine-kinase LECRK3 [Olea europaea subsp. europaea]
MAVFPSFLIISALMVASAQQQRYSNISLVSSLTPSTNSSWLSASGLYAFGFYNVTNGYAVGIFLAGIPEKTVVWTANRDDPVSPSNVVLVLTNDGRLILRQEDRDDKNMANPRLPLASASMLDSGNFVLYDSAQNITWQSFDNPTDTLLPGQHLSAGEEIVSSASKSNPAKGIFSLRMQADGNLVQYPAEPNVTSSDAYYSTGFLQVIPGNWSLGCERNFSMESCKDKDQNVSYRMRSLDNTVWEDTDYDIIEDMKTKEDCENACLGDCNCDAVFFKDGICRKQKLPLRYGRRLQGDSNVALIKVGTRSSFTQGVPNNSVNEVVKKRRLDNFLIISISLVALAALILAISWVYVHQNHVGTYMISNNRNVEMIDDVGLRAFTYAELVQATNEFKEELGRGASGTVYKGILSNNETIVAVKRLEKELAGMREFQTEMKVIGKTYHRNLVRLLGYCFEGSEWLLVYEYMSNGSLADILFNPENRPCWEERIRISLDIARGILYLHEECETRIIHCDIKPQNILMDEHRCAKISDFGLAKLLMLDQTYTNTGIRGTRGYVAPEWHMNLPVTVKADVYSFGIVLLEIICCRRSVDRRLSENEAILQEWVYNCYAAGELNKLVGYEDVDTRTLDRMIKIGIWCIQDEPSMRPSMKNVLLMLDGTLDIPVPPCPNSFRSSI